MSLSIDSPGTGSAPRPGLPPGPGRASGSGRPGEKSSRRTTRVRRNALVMAWPFIAAVLAALTIMGPLVSWGTWLPLHTLLLGGIDSVITIWSAHFADTLLHRLILGGVILLDMRLCAHNLGTTVVPTGITMGQQVVALIGVVIVMAQVVAGVVAIIVQYWRAIVPRLASLALHYIVSLVLPATGALLGFFVAWPNAHGRSALAGGFYLTHTTTMLLGFVGITVLDTPTAPQPTMLRTPTEPTVPCWTTRGLPYLVGGTALVAVCGLRSPLAGLGTLVYLDGTCVVLVPVHRTARRVPLTSFATVSATASVAWFVGHVAVLGVRMVLADDAATTREATHSLRLLLAAGFALQILVTALSYLAPVMFGGGPAATRATNAITDRFAAYWVTAASACLLLTLYPGAPWQVRVVIGTLVALVISYLLVGMILSLREVSQRKRPSRTPRTSVDAAPTSDPADHRPTQPRRGTR